MVNYPQPVHKSIGEVVEAVSNELLATLQAYDPTIQAINYMYGNLKEIQQRLIEGSANATKRKQQYPLFIYLMDVAIERGDANNLYGRAPNLNIIIANHTKNSYNSEERDEKQFEPILRPLYRSFLKHLSLSRRFSIQSERRLPHTMIEHFYWGRDENTLNFLPKNIDAIEITNLEVNIQWNFCHVPINSNI